MSEQTIFLDENDLLSLLNGGSFHTFEERKRKQFENNKLDKE
ncbi:hypothetical protein [Staphylococcus haemolyticus]|nr:hypothetical protein [Staphylococcus haemolyticus]